MIAGAGEYDGTHVFIITNGAPRLLNRGEHSDVDRIAFFRPLQGDRRNVTVYIKSDSFFQTRLQVMPAPQSQICSRQADNRQRPLLITIVS